MLLLFFSIVLCIISLVGVSIWLMEPINGYFDKTKIDLSNRSNYFIVDKYEDHIEERQSIDFSVIFPAYNEEKRIISTLDSAIRFLDEWCETRTWQYEIIIVDDGSNDSTSKIVLEYYKLYPSIIRYISLRRNQGKGAAVKVGVQHALGRYILMADADGATEITDLDELYYAMQKLEIVTEHTTAASNTPIIGGMVLGSRAHLAEKSISTRAWYRTILMKGFHVLVMLFCTQQIQDTQCGFKLFTHSVARLLFDNLHLYRWAFDIELIYQADVLKIPMMEVAVNWQEIEGSKLIKTKLDIVTTSLTMARDIVAVRIAYLFQFWQLPKWEVKVEQLKAEREAREKQRLQFIEGGEQAVDEEEGDGKQDESESISYDTSNHEEL